MICTKQKKKRKKKRKQLNQKELIKNNKKPCKSLKKAPMIEKENMCMEDTLTYPKKKSKQNNF